MSTDRDTTRVVRSWLEAGVTRLPDRVLDAVLDQVPATPQRRPFWRAWRTASMSNPVRYALAAAAALVVALVGYQFLPSSSSNSGASAALPSPTPPAASAAPTRQPPFPSGGSLALGRHLMTLDGVRFTVEIVEPGWTSDGENFFGKGNPLEPDGMSILFWPEDPEFVYADSCAEEPAPPVGRTAADMAAAITEMPQLELVSGPTSVIIGGRPAQQVVVHVPDDVECESGQQYWLWGNAAVSSRWATGPGSTFSVWIIDVAGTRLQIDAESYPGAAPEIGEEMRAIVESIRFE